ncbi:acetamidase/formamidase family protein [Salinispora arenicola]|uniref:acetamidase/formamidase family protein n=1 Tax=Salinispora arenicola TaxID=168697 RepID=UPI00037DDC87|nr:acetamidase/formamidase family protein [Salinispora arenicola]
MSSRPSLVEHIPSLDEVAYTFGSRLPVAYLRPGDVVSTYTHDCFAGRVRTADDLPSRVCEFPYLNPVTGPFFIEDAQPGDTLAVHFVTMLPDTPTGVSATFPHFGALTGTHTTAMLQPPLPERVWVYDIDLAARVVRYHAHTSDHTVDLPLDPMLGTVGVAPAGFEARSTITCDSHGGNLDTPELRPGTTVYLPVYRDGALLAFGDGHARQGHGELSGVAVETAMRVILTVEVIKGVSTAWPRIETDTAIMSVGCARPLEDAYRIAHHDLVGWVSELTGLNTLDAYQLVAQAGEAPVGNVVDPNYTIAAKINKTYVGGHPYGDVHRRLRPTRIPSVAGFDTVARPS